MQTARVFLNGRSQHEPENDRVDASAMRFFGSSERIIYSIPIFFAFSTASRRFPTSSFP
jgi:hypothetical protein